MSRKKDIAVLAPTKALLFGLSDAEARRQLERLSARELRKRRTMVEHVRHPMQDPKFRQMVADWEEANEKAKKMLAEVRARNLPAHPTVQ